MSHSKLTANTAPIDPRTSDDAVRTQGFQALLLIASGGEKTSTSSMKRVTEVAPATLEEDGALTSVVAANVGALSIATAIKFPSAEIIPQRNSSTTRRVCPHLLAYPDKSRAGKHTLITDDGSSSHEGVRGERAHMPATSMPIVLSQHLRIRRITMSIVVNALTSWTEAANRAAASSDRPPGWGLRFLRWCVDCSERSRQRQALSELDDHFLKDIGKTRQEAMTEASKPFWR